MSFPGIEPGTAHFSLRAYCELALSPHRPLWQVTWPHIIKSLAIIRKRVDAHNASATPDKRVELCLAEEVDDLNYLASIVCESWDPVSRVGVARRCFYCKLYPTMGLLGVDRFINEPRKYVRGNMVACCVACNLMKGTLDPFEFLRRCRVVANHSDAVATAAAGASSSSQASGTNDAEPEVTVEGRDVLEQLQR